MKTKPTREQCARLLRGELTPEAVGAIFLGLTGYHLPPGASPRLALSLTKNEIARVYGFIPPDGDTTHTPAANRPNSPVSAPDDGRLELSAPLRHIPWHDPRWRLATPEALEAQARIRELTPLIGGLHAKLRAAVHTGTQGARRGILTKMKPLLVERAKHWQTIDAWERTQNTI